MWNHVLFYIYSILFLLIATSAGEDLSPGDCCVGGWVGNTCKECPFGAEAKWVWDCGSSRACSFGENTKKCLKIQQECLQDTLDHVGGCFNGGECLLKIGGEDSECLAYEYDETLSRGSEGDLVEEEEKDYEWRSKTQINGKGWASLALNIKDGAFDVTTNNDISIESIAELHVKHQLSDEGEKHFQLVDKPSIIQEEFLNAGGVPVYVRITAEPILVVSWTGEVAADSILRLRMKGKFILNPKLSMTWSSNDDEATISLESDYDCHGKITEGVCVQDPWKIQGQLIHPSQSINAEVTAKLMYELTYSLNGIPIALAPTVYAKLGFQAEMTPSLKQRSYSSATVPVEVGLIFPYGVPYWLKVELGGEVPTLQNLIDHIIGGDWCKLLDTSDVAFKNQNLICQIKDIATAGIICLGGQLYSHFTSMLNVKVPFIDESQGTVILWDDSFTSDFVNVVDLAMGDKAHISPDCTLKHNDEDGFKGDCAVHFSKSSSNSWWRGWSFSWYETQDNHNVGNRRHLHAYKRKF